MGFPLTSGGKAGPVIWIGDGENFESVRGFISKGVFYDCMESIENNGENIRGDIISLMRN